MFVQAIQGSGKTHLASSYPDVFLDIDSLLNQFRAEYDIKSINLSHSALLHDFLSNAERSARTGGREMVILSHFNPSDFGFSTTLRFTYRPDQYRDHLILIGRVAAVSTLPDHAIINMAERILMLEDVVTLHPGEFLGSRLIDIYDSSPREVRESIEGAKYV